MPIIVIAGGDHPLKNNVLKLLEQEKPGHQVIDFDAFPDPGTAGKTGAGAVETILTKYNRIDGLIFCPPAHAAKHPGPGETGFVHQNNDSWEPILHTVLTSALFTCQAVLPGMMRRKFGRIINVVPVKALRGESGEAVYCSALGGLVTMTRCVAKEVGRHNITMNNICYGLLDTREGEIREGSTDYVIIKQLPVKRNCSYEDIVNTIRFLISAEAAYLNGKDIILDGGVL